MAIACQRRVAKLETQTKGDQIPIMCERESDVAAAIDAMIAAGDLAEADRVFCVHWLDCTGPKAPSDDDLRALLAQCEAEEALFQFRRRGASASRSTRSCSKGPSDCAGRRYAGLGHSIFCRH